MNTLENRINQALSYFLKKNNLKKLDRNAMARYCGVSVAAVGQWVNGKTISLDSLKNAKAAQYLGVNPYWLAGDLKFNMLDEPVLNSDQDLNDNSSQPNSEIRFAPVRFVEAKNPSNRNYVRIPIYRDVKASCGDGIENFLEDVSDYMEIDPELLKLMGVKSNPKHLKIIYSAEYSMYPTVAPDSPLFIDVSDRDSSALKSGNVYVFTHNHELRMKRIFVTYGTNTVKLTSDNPDKNRYPDEYITNEQLNEINFIGRLELALVRP